MRNIQNALRCVSAAALAIGLSTPATAQPGGAKSDATSQSAEELVPVDEQPDPEPGADGVIVVTGTRIIRDGFQAPTPVSVLTKEQIDVAAPTTIADFVNQLPALGASITPRTARGTIGGGTGGANLLNLRDLGVERTLVLLDGRRVTPSFVTGAVDLNTLPTALIQRVDVVTGGASAAFGSDAVAGVVNFILNPKFTGVTARVQSGISTYGDARSFTAEVAFGHAFADGRAHVVVAADYSDSGSALLGGRGWFQHHKLLTNTAAAIAAGQPKRLILPNTEILATRNGVVPSGPLRGLQFDDLGRSLSTPFDFGTLVAGNLVAGSSTAEGVAEFQYVQAPLERGNVFGRASFDLTPAVEIFAEASYGDSRASNLSSFYFPANPTVQISNAFLPADVRARLVTAGVTSIPVSSTYYKLGQSEGINDRSLTRGLIGLNADLGKRWKASIYAQRGEAKIRNRAVNAIRIARLQQSFDSVIGPTGAIVCRSTLTAPTNGCVPINPLGSVALTQEQRNWVLGTAIGKTRIEQDVFSASVNGDLFSLGAGPVSVAFGGEYRRDEAVGTGDAESLARVFTVGNYQPFNGKLNVKEAFAELVVPILKDSAFGRSLELNGAVRVTDYSVSGTVTTWKAGATYQPIEDLTLRFTRSRDIRAPNLNELFLGATIVRQNITDPFRANAPVNLAAVTTGNINLTPEIARTLTAGVIYRPHWFSGLKASVDLYDVRISDAIATSAAAAVLASCFQGDTRFCDFITRDGTGVITQILTVPFNQREERARGVDIELGYRTPASALVSNWGGDLYLRGFVSYVDQLFIDTGGTVIGRAGEVGTNLGASQGAPRIRGLISAGYDSDRVNVQLTGRLIGSSHTEKDYGPLDLTPNDVPAIFYLNFFAGYTLPAFGGDAQLFVAADNLLNTSPPVTVSQDAQNVQSFGTNSFIYDTVGRNVRAGIKVKF